MPAYWISRCIVNDPVAYKRYTDQVPDIIAALGSPDFLRVRVGIGRPPGQQVVSDFVLSNFGTVERKELPVTLELAADACELIVSQGLGAAQQRFHGA